MSLSTNVTLTVNDYDIKLSRNLKFYENDQLKLIFTLNYWGIDNAKGSSQRVLMPLNALSAILFIETPLGVDSIESVTIEENVVTFYLTSNQTQHIGISRMQIQLSDADGCQITLPPMNFEVRENIYDDEVILSQVLLADEDKNIVVDEDGNAINTGTQVSTQTYAIALSAEDETTATTSQPTKQIKDFNLKTGASGEEDLLIQDSDGATKRIKTSEFLNVDIDLTLYYTKEEIDTLLNNKANISHTHTVADIEDMPDYALKTDVPTNTSDLINNSGFITIDEVPEADLTGYATETYVNTKIAEASLGGEVDLSGYVTKDELNTKANISHTHTVSEITNLVIPTVDVDKNYVDTQLATKANIEDIPNLDGYALKSEIPTVPTKTSELANDSGFITTIPTEYVTENELNAKGYLTEHQDISMKADKTELHTHDNKTVLDNITETKITEWNNKSDFDGDYNSLTNKPNIPTVDVNKNYVDTQLATKANKSEIPSLDGYATETYVQNKIAEASLSGGEVDLSGLATKDDLATKADISSIPTKTSQLNNDSGFITSVPSEYITESELDAKGYLTEHQDITGKADKTELHNHTNKTVLDDITSTKVTEWNNKSNFDGNYNSLTNKPTIPTVDVDKSYVDTQLATKANVSDIPNLDGYALKTEIPTVPTKTSELANDSGFINSIPSEYVTEAKLNEKGYLTEHQDISGKANISDLSTVATSGNYNDLINTPTIPNEYVLPIASTTTLGGIKVGSGLSIDTDGVLSATGTGGTDTEGTVGNGIIFNDSYTADCNRWLSNGYVKTEPDTSNLPTLCTDADRWGVLFFIAENATNGTGTQMYFPIDGVYKGRVFTRSLVNMSKSEGQASEWVLLTIQSDIIPNLVGNTVTNKTLTLTVDKYQYAVLSSGDSVVLPSVSSFTEIHLFFKASSDLTLTFPSVKWQSIPSITSGHTYEIIFTYVVDEWLAGVICYE